MDSALIGRTVVHSYSCRRIMVVAVAYHATGVDPTCGRPTGFWVLMGKNERGELDSWSMRASDDADGSGMTVIDIEVANG